MLVLASVTPSSNHIPSTTLAALTRTLSILYVTIVGGTADSFAVASEAAVAEHWSFLVACCVSEAQNLAVMLWLEQQKDGKVNILAPTVYRQE